MGQALDHDEAGPQGIGEVRRLTAQRDPAALELAHVEDLVHEVEQKGRGIGDLASALGLATEVVGIGVADPYHADDAVDRGADIVAHALEELGFCAVRALGLVARGAEKDVEVALRLQALLEVLALGDAARVGERADDRGVQDDGDELGDADDAQRVRERAVDVDIAVVGLALGPDEEPMARHDDAGAVRDLFLDGADDLVLRALELSNERLVVRGRELAVALDHDHAALGRAVAVEQALHRERIAPRVLRVRVVQRDEYAPVAHMAGRADVDDRAVVEGHSRRVDLRGVLRHIENDVLGEVVAQKPVADAVLRVLRDEVALRIEQDRRREAKLLDALAELIR